MKCEAAPLVGTTTAQRRAMQMLRLLPAEMPNRPRDRAGHFNQGRHRLRPDAGRGSCGLSRRLSGDRRHLIEKSEANLEHGLTRPLQRLVWMRHHCPASISSTSTAARPR